ncbi:FAD-binding oxidoreductase [Mesorhizobium loti]|uniref:FAD-binding oxidoreductase n=1 Tax=Mesorhizobium jarvisii TaxID=1777867 RepID=A0A6M7TMZ6_9HYPH|nr:MULTISPECIES: FAD-binding oxidoreductase [Mesorhizobium]OBQ69169.1 PTS sugar transporter subunit IID [Mesorhizobium loti]QKC66130.1 FAD-binding oxidoreductase [Mesorhizobium jarvisii]QKD12043.1 FAD-binding oxidoreductase [Mesorhizobium loti]RJT38148.1 FAD-binding oxidoreductase [Mesorhizobium jarvisii]
MTSFPFTEALPIQFQAPLPKASEVVVIGGGVIGVTTALFLGRRNISVTLLEKGRIAGEQSSRNWGWIRQQGRDADELPVVIEAQRLWRQLAEECGEDIGLRQAGVTYLARTDKEMAGFAKFLKIAEIHGVDTRLLDQGETARLIPAMSRSFKGAMTTPSDMRAEPWVAVSALARLAAREGVTIIENCAARMLDISAGRVSGVWTEQGRIATSSAVVASGAWTSLFLRAHGVSIPQLSVRATVAATGPMPEIHSGAVADEHIAFRRRQDGGYTLASGGTSQLYVGPDAFRHATKFVPALMANPFGTSYLPAAPRGYPDSWSTPRRWNADEESPFERIRILNPAPKASALRDIEREFAALFTQFKTVPIKASWAGMIDAMPDVVPVVDRAAEIPGLVIATGMSGHGFGIGPGMGRVVSDLVQGNEIGHDLHRFRQSRFSDGSPIKLGPSL